jgi:PIN domain nuclease of toxin-antitoxin system
VRLLLDTHVFLWWAMGGDRLDGAARSAIADPEDDVYVSAASVWELSIKANLGKIVMPTSIHEALRRSGFLALPITVEHAEAAGALPRHHADPFDRMLVAQAMLGRMTLVTRDPALRAYGVAILQG